jgi:hypothetical protein
MNVGRSIRNHFMLPNHRLDPATAGFAALALGLLGLTVLWHIPMMLWDHLDLVPIYQAWQEGTLWQSDFWNIHGGHMHTAAYAVLLVTTALSGGQPWLDCVVSWSLLVLYAVVVLRLAAWSLVDRRGRGRGLACIAFLALYPGHLVNLQWGWQVAVFLCLLGVAVAVACLAAPKLSWWRNAAALFAALVAYFSFATGIALIPVALAMIGLRRDLSKAERIGLAIPWMLLGLLILLKYQSSSLIHAASSYSLAQVLHYTLNFLGAGIARFATDLAPWLAVIAIVTGLHAFVIARHERVSLYWLGFLLFATFSAGLTAFGRADFFGADHAFATRYVSFSSLFWLGWLGLTFVASRSGGDAVGKWQSRLAVAVMVLATANALHMIKQAARVSEKTAAVAAQVRETYPQIDEALLRSVYFEQSAVARERLQGLRDQSFAPFDQAPDSASGK